MKRVIGCGALAVCLTVGIIVGGVQAVAQSKSNLIEQTVELHLNQGTLLEALSTLSVQNRVPIGFVPAIGHKDRYVLKLDLKKTSLKNVLDTIVHQLPDYKWEVRDDVINFLPTKSKDEFVENVLNTPVQRFIPPKIPSSSRLRDAVTDLPEVQALLKANGIAASRYGYFEGYPSIYTDPTVDLRISGTDVRGVLNKIVRESEHKMWILSRSGKDLTSLDLGF